VAFSLGHPGLGPKRVSAELSRPKWGGILVSPNGVWKVLCRHGLNTRTKRLGLVAGYAARRLSRRAIPVQSSTLTFPDRASWSASTASSLGVCKEPRARSGSSPLLDSETDEVLYQATVEDGKVTHDFGLLLRAPNPFAPTNPVILFAGCETYGVKAAADFLAIRNYHVLCDVPLLRFGRAAALLDWLIPSFVKSRFYVLVVSTNVTGTYTTPPYLVRYWRLTPDIVL
jgi:hypothetical protein